MKSEKAPMEMNSKKNLVVVGALAAGALALGTKLAGGEITSAQEPEIKDLNKGMVAEQSIDSTGTVEGAVREPKTDAEILDMAKAEFERNRFQWGSVEEVRGMLRGMYPVAPELNNGVAQVPNLGSEALEPRRVPLDINSMNGDPQAVDAYQDADRVAQEKAAEADSASTPEK
jgi:hypothetical protein